MNLIVQNTNIMNMCRTRIIWICSRLSIFRGYCELLFQEFPCNRRDFVTDIVTTSTLPYTENTAQGEADDEPKWLPQAVIGKCGFLVVMKQDTIKR
jgi:hypothetical protein